MVRGVAREMLRALGVPGRLGARATVVFEHHAKDELPERSGDLALARARRYGETVVSTYRVAAGPVSRGAEEERA